MKEVIAAIVGGVLLAGASSPLLARADHLPVPYEGYVITEAEPPTLVFTECGPNNWTLTVPEDTDYVFYSADTTPTQIDVYLFPQHEEWMIFADTVPTHYQWITEECPTVLPEPPGPIEPTPTDTPVPAEILPPVTQDPEIGEPSYIPAPTANTEVLASTGAETLGYGLLLAAVLGGLGTAAVAFNNWLKRRRNSI